MDDTSAFGQSPEILGLLAHDLRWALLRLLSDSDWQVHELVKHIEQPMNLISYHLGKLRTAGLIVARRSEADARDVYYSIDLERLAGLYAAAGRALHPAMIMPPIAAVPSVPTVSVSHRILFICTHNSARSQMAEAFMRHLSRGAAAVISAGSHPTRVHPDAIRAMDSYGIDIRDQRARHIREVDGQTFDVVITVCDKAREVCPTFPGGTMLHWGFADPTVIPDDDERARAFHATAACLRARIAHYLTAYGIAAHAHMNDGED